MELFYKNVFFPRLEEFPPDMIIHLGDLVDRRKYINFNTANRMRTIFLDPLAEYVRENNTPVKFITGNHDCLSMDTECLTKNGWKYVHDLNKDDLILSKNGNSCEWTPINEILMKNFSGELVQLKSRDINMSVTPNHRVMMIRSNKKLCQNDEFFLANNLPSLRNWAIPSSSYINNAGIDLSDNEISLAGWIMTDGGFDKNGYVRIYQSKPENIKVIRNILDSLNFRYSYSERYRNITSVCGKELKKQPLSQGLFCICAEDSRRISKFIDNKECVTWINDLNHHQFLIFLESVVNGDGTWDGVHPEKKSCAAIYGQEKFLSHLQGACVQHGFRARLKKDVRGHYKLNVCKTNKICVSTKTEKKHYDGLVWCLSVPLGNFMVRKDGCSYFTGNCFYKDVSDINALDELLGDFQFEVYKQPTQINDLLLMPWICDQNQEKSLEMLTSSDARFVFGHFEIQGAEMDGGAHCDHGLPVSAFSRFDRVFSGHFHQKSTLGNIEYLGAPYQMTWSDFNQLRGFHEFDTEKNDLTFIKNPYKLFHKIVYNDSRIKSLDKLLDQDLSIYTNTFSKIVVESKENPYWFDIFVDKIQEQGPLDLKISEETILIEYGSDEEIARMIEDPIAILQKHCRSEKHGDAVEKKLTELYKAAQLTLN